MKNKKSKSRIIIILLIAFLLGLVIFLITSQRNNLTLSEEKWIDQNKNEVIDVAIFNDIPVLDYDGSGIIYDFLDYISDKYSLKFNQITYKSSEDIDYKYKTVMTSKCNKNDIILLEDNFVLINVMDKQYSDVKDITNLKIGILKEDLEKLENYFVNNNIEFVNYNTYDELKESYNKELAISKVNNSSNIIDSIIIPKTLFVKEIIENKLTVSYKFNDIYKYYSLKTNGSKEFNNILKKEYIEWKKSNYEDSYNANLLETYYKFLNISDADQKKLQSKSYVYGFTDYGIYNYLDNNKINGLSSLVLKDFNKFSNLSITYKKYNSLNKLLKDFNKNKVDFSLNLFNNSKIKNDAFETTGIFNRHYVVITQISNTSIIDNINSLKDKSVLTVKDSNIEKLLLDNKIKVKSYNNIKDLTTDFSSDSIAVIDLENYNFYKTSAFKDVKINYVFNDNDKYNYVIGKQDSNLVFIDLFNFYLNFASTNKIVSSNYELIAYKNSNILYIFIGSTILLLLYVVLDFRNHLKILFKKTKTKKKINLTKEEKIKYIDQLTSLKNRAYFNSRVESWDDSEVYPQSIIIIDLNNIAYINDNYGREEGDKVITEAANILIQSQLQNSEIIRSDGNEFLIYLVGYDEKQIVSYIRKLNKELKNLSHGFGAASGYSIINDAIKTIDDAVNEATLEMKNSKEDIEY